MNVFVLNTGRCGSMTFAETCRHITNYTAGHHSRSAIIGPAHFDFPPNHIEVDNRLSWFLGRLERKYGDDAFYVHMRRDDMGVARSYAKRQGPAGIYPAYRSAILMGCPDYADPIEVCLDYCDTINSNIEAFLANKSQIMDFQLENAKEDFTQFWERIGAEGDLDAALQDWEKPYNAADVKAAPKREQDQFMLKAGRKIIRIGQKLPYFLKNA